MLGCRTGGCQSASELRGKEATQLPMIVGVPAGPQPPKERHLIMTHESPPLRVSSQLISMPRAVPDWPGQVLEYVFLLGATLWLGIHASTALGIIVGLGLMFGFS